jgi:hypothetical protein
MKKMLTIKIEGVDNLSRFLDSQNDKILEKTHVVMRRHAEKQLIDARSRINGITGETARSLRVLEVWKAKKSTGFRVGPNPADVEAIIRAQALEYGHAAKNDKGGIKIVPAHPFLRPAFDADKRKTKDDLKKAVQEQVSEFNRGGGGNG